MVKTLLGVRKSTPTANCLIELGKDNIKTIIKNKRKSFLLKKLSSFDDQEPLNIMMEISRRHNTKSYRMIINSINDNDNSNISPRDICLGKDETHTKFVIYRSIMNPNLSVHPVYLKGSLVPDYLRISFTRLRLTSHNLQSEKGRWSRTPPNRRVCSCDRISVQDEHHALLKCPRTHDIRRRYNNMLSLHSVTTVTELLENENLLALCEFIHLCMKTSKY